MTELPDDLRAPLHGLQADRWYLVARIREADDEEAALLSESIRNRLSQIESAAYRLNAERAAREKAEHERDRIERETIERCAQVADGEMDSHTAIAAAIRALILVPENVSETQLPLTGN